MSTKHVHIAISARDCDGMHEFFSIIHQPMEKAFWLHALPLTEIGSGEFTFTSKYDENVDQTLYTLSLRIPTEEGFHSEMWYECMDDDDDEPDSQRDEYAERMGY